MAFIFKEAEKSTRWLFLKTKKGGKMLESKREKLRRLLIEQSLHEQPVTLSSGKSSNFYFDGKMVALTSEGAPLIAEAIKEIIGNTQVDAVGGPTIGADPMLGALSGLGFFRCFIIRKEPKKHGLSKWIEGPLNEKDKKVVIIDDVATSGGSILKSINILKAEFPQIEIVKVIVLVDRQEGAEENLREKGYVLESVFKADEFISLKKASDASDKKCMKAA